MDEIELFEKPEDKVEDLDNTEEFESGLEEGE
jgi:hypothetical protein